MLPKSTQLYSYSIRFNVIISDDLSDWWRKAPLYPAILLSTG